MFDLNMDSGYRARWRGTFSFVEDDHVAVTRSDYDESERTGTVEIILFQMEDGNWGRTDITLTQRCYAEEQVISALDRAGFSDIEVFDAVEDLQLANQVGRSFFLGTRASS